MPEFTEQVRRQSDAAGSLTAVKQIVIREAVERAGLRPVIFLKCYVVTILPLTVLIVTGFAYPSWPLFIVVALVAGFTQNALGVLMHEASHYFLHPDKKLNDVLANLLLCLPIFNTVQGYRTSHLQHHRYSGDSKDPYYPLYGCYSSRGDILRGFLFDLTGVTAVKTFLARYIGPTDQSAQLNRYTLPALIVVQGVIFVVIYRMTGSWSGYLLLWLVPLLTIPIAINRLRIAVEHVARPGSGGTVPSPIEFLCIAPYGYSFHYVHHLMPAIPYFHLKWAHDRLVAESVDLTEDKYADGYVKTFFELMRDMPRRPDA